MNQAYILNHDTDLQLATVVRTNRIRIHLGNLLLGACLIAWRKASDCFFQLGIPGKEVINRTTPSNKNMSLNNVTQCNSWRNLPLCEYENSYQNYTFSLHLQDWLQCYSQLLSTNEVKRPLVWPSSFGPPSAERREQND